MAPDADPTTKALNDINSKLNSIEKEIKSVRESNTNGLSAIENELKLLKAQSESQNELVSSLVDKISTLEKKTMNRRPKDW
jgi:predicted  nucleic acid-binding Zn-ribbon protein